MTTARSVQVMKEFRLLAWPWVAVTSAAVLALVLQNLHLEWGPFDPEAVTALGSFVGIPLLAGLGLGTEFQYRTLGFSLAQPVERSQMWLLKVIVSLLAVLPPAILFSFGGNPIITEYFQRSIWLSLAFLLLSTAAAFPMTLIARSTIGGLALQMISSCPFLWVFIWIGHYLRRPGHFSSSLVVATGLVELMYAAAMVWWGRRMFLGYQTAEGMQSVEFVLPGATLVPAFFADWFRCRPSLVVLNLLRRELRLTRAIWPLTALGLGLWAYLVIFHILPVGHDTASQGKIIDVILATLVSVLIAVLAGVLSLGEEKNWGTHEWQLTLPVSPSLQWFVKLSVGIFLSVFCGAMLPMSLLLIAGWYRGDPTILFPLGIIWAWPLQMAAITFVAFWCSCLLKGTTRAAVFTFPACGIIFSAAPLGQWFPDLLSAPIKHFFAWLISGLGPAEAGRTAMYIFSIFGYWQEEVLVVPAALLAGIALVQSHRLYREPSDDSNLRAIRYLMPMFLTLLTCTVAMGFFFDFAEQSFHATGKLANEVDAALEKVILTQSDGRPITIDAKTLAANSSLSPETQRWLGDSNVVIVPRPSFVMAPVPAEFNFGFINSKEGEAAQPYSAVVRFPRSSCSLSHRKPWPKVAIFAAACNW